MESTVLFCNILKLFIFEIKRCRIAIITDEDDLLIKMPIATLFLTQYKNNVSLI